MDIICSKKKIKKIEKNYNFYLDQRIRVYNCVNHDNAKEFIKLINEYINYYEKFISYDKESLFSNLTINNYEEIILQTAIFNLKTKKFTENVKYQIEEYKKDIKDEKIFRKNILKNAIEKNKKKLN
jgi:hypothetical protein